MFGWIKKLKQQIADKKQKEQELAFLREEETRLLKEKIAQSHKILEERGRLLDCLINERLIEEEKLSAQQSNTQGDENVQDGNEDPCYS